MQDRKITDRYKVGKTIQLIVVSVLMIVFLLILLCKPSMTKYIYDNPTLLVLCSLAWLMSFFHLVSIIYDFNNLRKLAEEGDMLNKLAYLDGLTQIPNRQGLDNLFKSYSSPDSIKDAGCYMASLRNIKEVNQNHGHAAGDVLLKDFGDILAGVGDAYGTSGRNGGNQFLLVIDHCDRAKMESFLSAMDGAISEYNKIHPQIPIAHSYAYSLNSEVGAVFISDLLSATYSKLQAQAK